MALFNTKIGGYVSSSSHFQQNGDDDSEKNMLVHSFQPVESKVELEKFSKSAAPGRISENIRESTVTTKNVSRTTHRNESKVIQSSRREELHTKKTADVVDSTTSLSTTSVFNSYSQDYGRNAVKKDKEMVEDRAHNGSFYRTDSKESLWKAGSQSSGADIFTSYSSRFHDHHHHNTSDGSDARSLGLGEEGFTSSRYRGNEQDRETSGDSSITKAELARASTSSESSKQTGRETVFSSRSHGNFKAVEKISSQDVQKAELIAHSGRRASDSGNRNEVHKNSVYHRSRSASGDQDKVSVRSEGLGPQVSRVHDVLSLGKVVDDLKVQSSSLERTIEDLMKKRSKSLGGIDEHEKSLKEMKSTSGILSADNSTIEKESNENTRKVNSRKQIYREIPARAEYVTATREASTRYFKGGEYEWDDFPFKENTSSADGDQGSKSASAEARKEIYQNGLESTTAREYNLSRDEKPSRGETKTDRRVLKKTVAFEVETSIKTGLDNANHVDEFLGKKETLLRKSGDTVKQTETVRGWNETETFEGENSRKIGLVEAKYTDKRDGRSRHEASVMKRSTVTADAHDLRNQMTISSAPIEKRERKIVKDGWVSERVHSDSGDLPKASVANPESLSAFPSVSSKTSSSPDNSHTKKEAVTERSSSDNLTTRERYFSRNQRIAPLPPHVETEKKTLVDKRGLEREVTAKKNAADSAGERDLRDVKVISKTTESNSATMTTEEVKKKKHTSRSALWQKIEKLKNTVDSLNGLKSKKDLSEYVKQHPAKKADIEKRETFMVQRYSMTENRSGSKDQSSADAPDLEAMTLEELENWQREKEITRERERQERQEELERRRRELQLEREHHEQAMLLEREREVNERRERLLSSEKKMKEAERKREELQKRREADLEKERQKRQEEESKLKREREEQRRESIRLENEREALRTQLERLKTEKEEREREVAKLERERQEKMMVIEREKEASKLEWEKLDKERKWRELEMARIEREQEHKIVLLQRENEATRLDREQLVRETSRLDSERREKVVLLEREKEAARLEREKLENERRRREREVVGIERELQQKMMVLHEEKEAARFERGKLEMQAAKLEVERQQKLENLEKENKTARLERERLERERQDREKEGMKLEKEQQDKLAILQREIEATRLERERLEEERRKREAEVANSEIWHHEKFLVLEKEKEVVKLERDKLERERQERERETVEENEGRQIKFMILEKEKEAVLLEREKLDKEREDVKRVHRQVERQRETSKLDLERQQKMMSIERRRKTVELERDQHEKMLTLQKEKENTKREKEQLEQEKEIARKRLNELERLKEFAELEREDIERQKQALEREREAERLRKERGDLGTNEERRKEATSTAREEKVIPIIELRREVEPVERGQLQNAEIQQSESTSAVTVIKVDPQTNNKMKTADPHDTGVTYVEIDHLLKPRALEKRPAHWWSASTAEDVDKILELGLPEWRTASKAETFDQLQSNHLLRKPRRMNGIRRRSIRRRNGRPRRQEEDDGVEVCVRVRGKENAANVSRYTVTKQAPLENTIILRQTRESAAPFVRTMRVDDKYGAGTVTLENGVVKIREGEGGKRRKAWSMAIKREEKLSNSDGSHVVPVEGTSTEIKTRATENGKESTHTKVVPVRITTEPIEKSRTKRLKFVREFRRTGSFSKGRRASAKKLHITGGKHRKGTTTVSTVSGGDLTVSNSSKAYYSPLETVKRIRRLYKTTNHSSGWNYNGGRLEITVHPSPAKAGLQQQLDESMSKGGITAESEALLHSAQTLNGGKLRLRDHGNLAETRVKVTRGTGTNINRPITGDARSVATFNEKYEVISDTGYNTLSDGEVGKPGYGRVEEISGGEHSPPDGQWSPGNTHKETVHSREKLPSRKMSWAVGDITSKFSRRKLTYNDSPRFKDTSKKTELRSLMNMFGTVHTKQPKGYETLSFGKD